MGKVEALLRSTPKLTAPDLGLPEQPRYLCGVTDTAAYRWLDPLHEQTHFAVAACVTVVRGLDVAETVLAFGGDPSLPPQPLQSFDGMGYYLEVAAVGQMGDVVVAVEPNGFQGSRPEVLRVASRMGDAVSVYWNVNLHCRFSYSVGGELVSAEVAELVRQLLHRSSLACRR